MIKASIAFCLIVLFLTGCESTYEDRGAAVGVLVGGVLGNQVGGGRGQILATGAGMVAGAMIGASVGAKMDEVDRQKMAQAHGHAFEYGGVGEATEWKNPDSGNSGSVTPTRTYQRSDGQYCREYQQEIIIDGKVERGYGTACRQPDGSWQIMGG